MELDIKKIKEIKNYAKNDVKGFIRNGKDDKERYPKGITSYYEELYQHNNDQSERLKNQFGYTDEKLKERAEIYHEAFWGSWNWWQNQLVKNENVMAKYKPIFDEAEKIAENVDVSDIEDGFPCGFASLYLKAEAKNTDLGKVLRSQYHGDSYSAKVWHLSAFALPIKMPTHGQCMAFSERICEKVAEFLNSKDIPTGVYSYID